MKKILIIAILYALPAVAIAQFPYQNYNSSAIQTQQTLSQLNNQTSFCTGGQCTYIPLEPLSPFDSGGYPTLARYLQSAFVVLISLGGLFAVTMLTLSGIRYMLSESFTDKSKARERIVASLWGLVLLAASWLILHTINPQLLQFNLSIGNGSVTNVPNMTPISNNGTDVLLNGQNPLQLTSQEQQNIQGNINNPNASDCAAARESLQPSFIKVLSSIKATLTDNVQAQQQEDQIVREYVQSCVQAGY